MGRSVTICSPLFLQMEQAESRSPMRLSDGREPAVYRIWYEWTGNHLVVAAGLARFTDASHSVSLSLSTEEYK